MILSIVCILITLALITCYELRKLSFWQTLMIAWISSSYFFFSPTLNSFFIVGSLYGLIELFYIVQNKKKYRIGIWMLLLLPAASCVLFWLIVIFDLVEFEVVSNSQILTNSVYFMLKLYLPYFLIAHRVYRELDTSQYSEVVLFFRRLLIFSAWIGLFQLIIFTISQNSILTELVGLKERYAYDLGPIRSIRINAFLAEPKELATLMGLGIALFIKREKLVCILFFLVGVLTLSNTFFAIVLLLGVFWCVAGLMGIPKLSGVPIVSIFIFFFIFFISEQLILSLDKRQLNNKMPLVSTLVINRLIDRYDERNPFAGKMLFGFPLQADLEAPIHSFIEDNPLLFFTGLGAGNTTLIPNEYFRGTWAFSKRESGDRRWHANMGWLYWLYQFGIPGVILVYFQLAKRIRGDGSTSKALAFLLTIFIVTRVELLIAIAIALNKKEE